MVFVAHKYMPDQIPVDELRATFAARHHTLRYLVKSLRNQAHARTLTSYLITGPRGSGKTTLIRMLCLKLEKVAELRQAWLPVRFPEELPTVTSLRDLLSKALEILADADIPGAQDWHQRVEEQDDEAQGQDIAIAGLQWIAREQNRRLVLFIENLDLVFERGLTNTTQATLRRLLMTEPFMMIIGSAVRPFPELQSYDKAFFNYFCPVELEPLSEEQAYKILKRRAAWDGNKDFEQQQHEHRGKIRAISFLTGGNPRLLLMLYEILTHHEVQSAVQALRKLVDELTPLLKDILEHQLAKQQVKVVDALMRLDGNATPSQLAGKSRLSLNIVTSQLKRLEEARIVEVTGGGKGRPAWYSIRDRLFYTWYQMRYLQPGRRRIELFVRVLQIWFEADERLQQLHHLCKTPEPCDKAQVAAYAEAAEYFAVSLAKTQHEGLARRLAIKARLKAGQADLAVNLFSEFEADTTTDEGATAKYVGLTRQLRERGDLQEAIELARIAMERDCENVKLLFEYAAALALSGNHAEASSCLDRIMACSTATKEDKAKALYNRGVAKHMQGDMAGAIADYTAVIGIQSAPPKLIAEALNNRGVCKGAQGDTSGEVADLTTVLGLPGTPPALIAQVLYNRGVAKDRQRDTIGAMADYTAIVGLEGAPTDLVAEALHTRAVAKSRQGDIDGAITDYTAVTKLQGVSPNRIAQALNGRGVSRSMQGDTAGGIEDCTGVLDLPGAPLDWISTALCNRGVAKQKQGDTAGAITDYTTAIELRGALPEQVSLALYNRAEAKETQGDLTGAIADRTAIVELRDAPSELVALVLYNRAVVKHKEGDSIGAIADWMAIIKLKAASWPENRWISTNSDAAKEVRNERQGIGLRFISDVSTIAQRPDIHIAAGIMAIQEALAKRNKNAANEVVATLRGWSTELADHERTQRIAEFLVALANLRIRDIWAYAFRELLKGQPAETLKELEFLRPAAEVLETGDMSKLDALAPEQRDFALHVLGKLGLNKPQND
jgi:tetratricopeptide (TPR) repeat protein